MPSSLRQLLKFIRVFGLSGGVRLWCSLRLQTMRGSSLLTLGVPGLAAPIRLRPRDLPIFWQIMVMQEYSIEALPQAARVNEAYRGALSRGHRPLIVDCGGHIGFSAIWFASRFPKAMIYCVEPNPDNFELLSRNIASYPSITALNGGIWGSSCDLEIANPGAGSASFRLKETSAHGEGANSVNSLHSYTIDEIRALQPSSPLLAVKIDIEGAEDNVFAGPTGWMSEMSMLAIELHDWLLPGQGTSRNLFRRIAENDFDVILRGENLLLFQVPPRSILVEQRAEEPASARP
jgi:FkbM family methyltransferase